MKKEIRTVVYDDELRIEAYRFEGIVQPFPNHFHEYYVIGEKLPGIQAKIAQEIVKDTYDFSFISLPRGYDAQTGYFCPV